MKQIEEQSYRFTTVATFTTSFSRCRPLKGPTFFCGTKLPISLEKKGLGEANRGTKLPFHHDSDFTTLFSR